jgi:hypothetical protein
MKSTYTVLCEAFSPMPSIGRKIYEAFLCGIGHSLHVLLDLPVVPYFIHNEYFTLQPPLVCFRLALSSSHIT